MIDLLLKYNIEIGTINFLLYVIVFTIWGGFKTDITHLTYTIKEKLGEKWMVITPITYFISAASMGIVSFTYDKWWLTSTLLACSISFALVGVFYDVRKNNKWKNTIHVGGAILAVLFGILFSLLSDGWYFGIAFLTFYLMIARGHLKIAHATYWAEAGAFVMIILSLLSRKRK